MTIGYSAYGQCLVNTSDAIDVYYSHSTFFMIAVNNVQQLGQFLKINGVWKLTAMAPTTGVVTTYGSASTTVYGSCTIENDPTTNFQTGMDLGWAVAAVMIIVFAIRSIYRR